MIEIDRNKKSIAILGCSYTHWHDGNCELESYPALIAKKYKNYNVVDLSIPGGSNDSAYLRLQSFQKMHNMKFDKVIFQITHYGRFLHMPHYDWWNIDIINQYYQHENYIYSDGKWKHPKWDNVTASYFAPRQKDWYKQRLRSLANYFGISIRDYQKWLYQYLESDTLALVLEKEIYLLNGTYGKENVLMFSWHAGIDSNDPISKDKCNFPENYIGSISDMLGYKLFRKLGVDDAPHYDNKGMMLVFKQLKPSLDKLLKT